MDADQKREFLISKGWGMWYNENYWVNPKTVSDPTRQDFTNYGLSLGDAYLFETEGWNPFPYVGLPELSFAVYRKMDNPK